jgi:site-specific DNA recombinase
MNLKWLIYCRVSSKKQVKEWNGLSSQEQKCISYAENVLWIKVEKVFNDEWISWWVFERKSIKELISYIDSNKDNNYTVIFEDLNRLSRDIQVHHLLRTEFRKRWVELQCPNFQFEETPEWTFRENMSVSMAQYEKEKNRQRVLSRQKSRLEQGFYCFPLPIWYKILNDDEN